MITIPDESSWPDPANPGLPLDPLESGYHWIINSLNDYPDAPQPEPAYWDANEQMWKILGDDMGYAEDEVEGISYVAPCKFSEEHEV